MRLTGQEFDLLRRYIHSLCGIAIPHDKSYLIEQRLEPVVVATGCKSFGEFYLKLTKNMLPKMEERIINAMTTNETSFFRDGHPFVAFKEYVLPKLGEMILERKARDKSRRGPKVSIWSAGASTGQEPYSLAMLIRDYLWGNDGLDISTEDFGLHASDISSEALSRAMAGEYSEMEMKRGLSAELIEKYFIKDGGRWVIDSEIRNMVQFRQINLIRPFAMVGGFDVILCRNVLIYFDNGTKARMIDQFYDVISEGGFLVLGATESLYGITDRFETVRYGEAILYRKPPKPANTGPFLPSLFT